MESNVFLKNRNNGNWTKRSATRTIQKSMFDNFSCVMIDGAVRVRKPFLLYHRYGSLSGYIRFSNIVLATGDVKLINAYCSLRCRLSCPI